MKEKDIDHVLKSVSLAVGGEVRAYDEPGLDGIVFRFYEKRHMVDHAALRMMQLSDLRSTLVRAFGGKEEFTTKHPTDSWVEEYKKKHL